MYDRTAYPETESPLVWMWANQAEAVDSAKAGYLKKRWFPPSIAEQEVADYATLKGAYEGLRTAYGTAKDAYEKAMTPPEADFFGDLFSPPEKKTPPTRPDLPTQIGDYKGLRVAPYKNTKEYKYTNDASNAKDKLKDVAANEFVADGEYGGGWGAFTMGLLPIEDGMGKSFGVFGYSKAAKMDASYVQMASHMCKTPDATTGHCAKVDGTDASLAF